MIVEYQGMKFKLEGKVEVLCEGGDEPRYMTCYKLVRPDTPNYYIPVDLEDWG